MRKVGIALLLVGAFALAPAGTASAARGGSERPWKGLGELTFDQSTLDLTGTGVASHLGRWTWSLEVTSDDGVHSTGEGTLTAANGDEVFVHLEQTWVSNDAAVFVTTITGGTGRFSDAAGSAQGGLTARSGPGSVGHASVWWSGTISY